MNPLSAWPVVAVALLALGTAFLLLRTRRPEPATSARFLSIDGLRGYLALGVFLHHSAVWYFYLRTGQWAVPPSKLYAQLGQSSVMLFFMITGFLFWSKLLDARTRPMSWSKLYISRVFRLTPLYAFATVCLVLASLYAAGFQFKEPLLAVATHTSQWLCFTLAGTPPINGFAETGQLLGVGWSLRYEWLFYASLPIGALLLRISPLAHFGRGAGGEGVPTVSPRPGTMYSWLTGEGQGVRAAGYLPLPWLLFGLAATAAIAWLIPGLNTMMLLGFGGGIIAAHVVRIEPLRRQLVGAIWSLVAAAALLAIVRFFPSAYSLPVMGLLTLAFTIIACGNSLFGILHWPASRLLGEVTYSIYLLHNFALFIAFRVVFGQSSATLSPTAYCLVICGLSPLLVLVCYATYHWIEVPAMAAAPKCHAWLMSRWTRRGSVAKPISKPILEHNAA